MSGKVQRPEEASEKLPTPDRSLSTWTFLCFFVPHKEDKGLGPTRRIEHCLDGFRMVCAFATHDEFKAVGRDERNIR